MTLGYLFARTGVEVTVLEQNDFFRDFRGDTVHPSTLEVLYELDLLDDFLKQPRSGEAATPVTTVGRARGEQYHLGPVFLPDGRHFLYLRIGKPEFTGIYVGSLDAKPGQQSSRGLLDTEYHGGVRTLRG